MSVVLATDRDRYLSNLAAYRTDGSAEEERADASNNWIEYFSNAIELACARAGEFESRLRDIRQGWIEKTHFRKGSAGAQLIDVLIGTPALSIKTAQELTGKSYPAARNAVNALVDAGILWQRSKNRKSGIFVAGDVVDAFNAYERSLATLSGDTAVEEPRRPVPQRRG